MNRPEGCRHLRRLVASCDAWPMMDAVRQRVRMHLQACASCRAWFLERLAEDPGAWAWLNGPATRVPRYRDLERRYGLRPISTRVGVAAVLILGLLVGLWWWQQGPPSPTVTPVRPITPATYETDLPLVEQPPENVRWYTFEVEGTAVLLVYTEEEGT